MKKISLILIIITIGVSAAWSFEPPDGGNDISDLYSPEFLSSGTSVTSMESVFSDIVNPAISGAKQRTTLDLNYVTLVNFSSDNSTSGLQGHSVNLGVTIPSKYGVFTGSGHFLTSAAAEMNIGTLGGINFSFSKDLFRDLYFGAGMVFRIGQKDILDWQLGLDLGILHFLGDVSFMKDFRWGFAIQNIGKWYTPVSGKEAFPSPFTPALGANFALIKDKDLELRVIPDLSFPTFQNVRFNLGLRFAYADFIGFSTSFKIDLQEQLNTNISSRSLVPAFGIFFKIRTDIPDGDNFLSKRGWNKNEIKTNIAGAPIRNNLWGFGLGLNIPLGVIDKEPPVITVDYNDTQYISPNLDGNSDYLEFSFALEDQRYVKGYTFKILNEQGEVVKVINNKDERPENKSFKNIMDALFSVQSGLTVPETLRWDGIADVEQLNEANETVTVKEQAVDGKYSFQIVSWDDNGNEGITQTFPFILDGTAPAIEIAEVESIDLIFSPNGDGNKDTFVIEQTGSSEDLWQLTIKDSTGAVVYTKSFENGAPTTIEWDGTDNGGNQLFDGVYSYEINATDRAGNFKSARLDNIILSTEVTPATLTIDQSIFSPNQDGIKDTILFTPGIPVKTGILSWELSVLDENKRVVRTYKGDEASLKETFSFDGKDNSGKQLKEGTYYGAIDVTYLNGNNPKAESPTFTVDVTPPTGRIKSDLTIFSPNSDGNKDIISIFQETSEEDQWGGFILDSEGNQVQAVTWPIKADHKYVWEGRNDEGRLVDDGTYSYYLTSTDKAGNTGRSNTVTFELSTEETEVVISVEHLAFSPNADSVKDKISIFPKPKVSTGIENFTINIKNSSDKIVKTFQGRNRIDDAYSWDGFDNNGRKLDDGEYYAEIEMLYKNGNNPQAKTTLFIMDNTYPAITLDTEYTLFSPNSDDRRDNMTITQSSSSEDLWEGRLENSDGEIVKTYKWQGMVSDFIWDGTDEAGNALSDGTYRYIVSSKDMAGNYKEEQLGDITIDTKSTPVFITVNKQYFSPNGDGIEDDIELTAMVGEREEIERWSLIFKNDNNFTVKRLEGKVMVPDRIIWDGKSDDNHTIEGIFTAVLEIEYEKGNKPVKETTPFTLDVSGPDVRISTAPVPFSPDNDNLNDELTVTIDTSDVSPYDKWNLVIYDPSGNEFISYSGDDKPAGEIIWDGQSLEGELVQSAMDYTYDFTVSDIIGNISNRKGRIPIDVLVVKERENRYKIQIASITFAAYSFKLVSDNSVQSQRNIQILDRLAEILKKYSSYKVQIEGHAVNIYWYNQAQAKVEEDILGPLSTNRAQSVKDALVARGVAEERITVVGKGGSDPLVPHSDLENRWKNRRVEFLLVK